MTEITIWSETKKGGKVPENFDTSTTTINLSDKRIGKTDLDPLKEFTELEILILSGNELQQIDLTPLSNCPKLTELSLGGNGDWKKAVEVDRAIRKARPPYDLFLHPARIPLEDIDLRNLEDKGQLRLWDDECEGICGI